MLDRYLSINRRDKYALNWLARSVPAGLDIAAAGDRDLALANLEGSAEVLRMRERRADPGVEPVAGNLLDLKVELASRMLSSCRFCERRCGADRAAGDNGWCKVGGEPRYSSDFLHLGEEPELVPSHTIFFSGCTFHCAYCQNWDIAMRPESGVKAEPALLAGALREGISQGSRNANFVGGNPDPALHVILETVRQLGGDSRFLPIVWNSNMYASSESMELLAGVADVYLGDFRYGNDDCASRLSEVEGYTGVVTRNFATARESAEVMVRHLVLPGHLECCTRPVMEWVAGNMPGAYFNLMFQYRPEYRASLFPEIDRRLSEAERRRAVEMAERYGL